MMIACLFQKNTHIYNKPYIYNIFWSLSLNAARCTCFKFR